MRGDASLVQFAAEGDQQAWERLVNQYAPLIWTITRDFKLAEGDAADVVQATWLSLLKHIDRLDYPARAGSWLAVATRNQCLRSLAARKRDRGGSPLSWAPDGDPLLCRTHGWTHGSTGLGGT